MSVQEHGRRSSLLDVRGLSKSYGKGQGCFDMSFKLMSGEVLGIVGESGSGKSTLLKCLSGLIYPDKGMVFYDRGINGPCDVLALTEGERRRLARSEWGIVHQNPRDGLRMNMTAGANIAEWPLTLGERHYEWLRSEAKEWLRKVELDETRIDDRPANFSGGMQQRVQIARSLVTKPRLVFMDEPTGGLDVSVQARILDLLRTLVREMGIAVIMVTHDLAAVRLMADRLIVMQRGRVVEEGLTDQVLDDPHHPYTQLLVSSVLYP